MAPVKLAAGTDVKDALGTEPVRLAALRLVKPAPLPAGACQMRFAPSKNSACPGAAALVLSFDSVTAPFVRALLSTAPVAKWPLPTDPDLMTRPSTALSAR